MDRVAIVINSYKNNSSLLTQAIRSCLIQDSVNARLIVSTVAGDPAIATAAAISKAIVIATLPKPGIYEQLNNALNYLGDAEWFWYFSGNDVALRTKSIDEINTCKRHGKKVCYSNYIATDAVLKNQKRTNFPAYNHDAHLKGNFVNDCAMVRRDVLEKYKPFALKWGNYAYYDFWLRIYKGEGDVFALNPRPEFYYRIMATSKHVLRKKNPAEKRRYETLRAAMVRSHL